MSFQKMYGLRGPSGLNMVNQAFIIVIAYLPRRRRRRRKIPGIGRYPMGPTKMPTIISIYIVIYKYCILSQKF